MFGFVNCGLLLLLIYTIQKILNVVWWKPKAIQRHFLDQGIRGPPFKPLIGSLGELARIYGKAKGAPPASPPSASEAKPQHSTLRLVFPHLHIWREKYGRVFLYWYGRLPRLSITDPQLIKEVSSNPRKYDQSIQHPVVYNLIGQSIIAMGGETWAAQRRLLSPLFLVDYLKGLSGLVFDTVEKKIEVWCNLMESANELEIDVHKEFESIAQNIIAKVIFGNDVDEGLDIVKLQSEQASLSSISVKTFYIPGWKFIPTKFNRRSKCLRQNVEMKFRNLIDRRNRSESQIKGNDWLALMLSSDSMSQQQIIDECCAVVIAGSESTNLLLAWACILLSIHTEWQDKARNEIHQVLKGRHSLPTTEILAHLKTLNMIINETLRLYPPIPFVMKKTSEGVIVEGFNIPAGTDVEVPIIAVHHDPQLWGDNVDDFNPERFADGIAKASKHPMAFMPFMQGPRICIGMNFAMMEARIMLASVLNRFKLTLSPKYKHEPVCGITLKPGNGAYVLLSKVCGETSTAELEK